MFRGGIFRGVVAPMNLNALDDLGPSAMFCFVQNRCFMAIQITRSIEFRVGISVEVGLV